MIKIFKKSFQKTGEKILFPLFLIFAFSANGWGAPKSLIDLNNPYRKVVDKYSKSGVVYSAGNLDARFMWSATYHSEEFRKAFAEQYERYYPNGQNGLASRLGHPWEGEPQVEFFVALYAKARSLKKLTGKDNLWDLSLRVDDRIYKPSIIEEVKLTPFESVFYPYLNPWSRGYRVIFALPLVDSKIHPLDLTLTSIAGKNVLRFNR